MPQTPLLGSGAIPSIPIAGATIGSDPGSTGIPGTPPPANVEAALTALQAEIVGLLTAGYFLTTILGEQARPVTAAASGAAYAIDCSLGNTFDITLTANCTLSIINPAPTGVDSHIVVILRQGGAGSFTATWPGSVVWQDPADGTTGGSAPTLWTAVGAQNVVELSTLDGGTTWGGDAGVAGTSFGTPAIVLGTAAAAGAATTAIRSDATIVAFDATVPTTEAFGDAAAAGSSAHAARRDHLHGMPAAPGHILLADAHATPFAFTDLLQLDDGSDFMWSD